MKEVGTSLHKTIRKVSNLVSKELIKAVPKCNIHDDTEPWPQFMEVVCVGRLLSFASVILVISAHCIALLVVELYD